MAGGVVKNAAARYQVQRRVTGRTVNGSGREVYFGVLPDAGDAENGSHPVGERHVDALPGAEGPEAEEHGGTLVTVDVPLDDRRPPLAGRRRVLVPGRFVGGGGQ